MGLPRRSRFDYGGVVFETSLPCFPWTPLDETVGGRRIAASGIPAAYIVRRDYMLELRLRIYETEFSDYLSLVSFGQSGQSFLWWPDADDLDTVVEVYLQSPLAGESWSPNRVDNFQRVFECSLTLRGVDVAVPWRPYFA